MKTKGKTCAVKSITVFFITALTLSEFVLASELKYDPRTFNRFRDAIVSGNKSDVNSLLASGLNVNATTQGNITPLMIATATMQNDIAVTLIQNDALISIADNLGRTALFVAASTGNHALVSAMLEYNDGIAAINMSDNEFGFTPLHASITLDDRESVALLLREGASATITDKVGMGTVQQICATDRRLSCELVRAQRR